MSLAKHLLLAGAIALACSQPVLAETVGQTLEQADRYWVEGKLVQAQQAFEAAVKAEPASVPARLRLAGFQLSQQQMEACIANYKQVIGQEPKNSKAWIGLGMAFLHISQPENARAAFDEAIRADPSRKEQLALLLAKLDEKAKQLPRGESKP